MAHDKRKIDDKIKKAYHKVNVEIAAKIADASKLAMFNSSFIWAAAKFMET